MSSILDAKYEKADLKIFMTEQYEYLSPSEREILLKKLLIKIC